LSQLFDYLLVFTITGLSAVAIKYLGGVDRSFWAGIVAMIPIKTLIAFVILNSQAGPGGIRAAMPGMWAGAIALVLMLTTMAWTLERFQPATAITLSMTVWIAAVMTYRYFVGSGAA
jgi:uncharacterized membrane protein (GlpM family)